MSKRTITVDADALHQVLQALMGPAHLIRELQTTRGLPVCSAMSSPTPSTPWWRTTRQLRRAPSRCARARLVTAPFAGPALHTRPRPPQAGVEVRGADRRYPGSSQTAQEERRLERGLQVAVIARRLYVNIKAAAQWIIDQLPKHHRA